MLDPRYVESELKRLGKELEDLKKSTLPLLSYQRGPIPGWMLAGQIGPGLGQKSAMHLNLDGNFVGMAPRQTVTDTAGVVRVEIGNLAAEGVSPAQYGMRTSDASGNPIFDTIGLTSVMKSLGVTDVGSSTVTSTTFAAISGTAINFTIARQVNLLTMFLCTGFLAATGNAGLIRCNIPGVGTSGNMNLGTSNIITESFWRFYPSVAAGSYTLQMEAAVSAGATTLNITEAAIQLFQLGS